ncbi:hypothetical protein A1O1_02758 [Capronia coronata CBS 617.96]|uniref:Alpha/beta hydrolase fold-3 domain-containing protein n=1 Tax=Capronia coronata CBS 617.96 TaxID=1182541 RepID=W9ZIR6_9EURO|nr:uncharacterized protein A1O1_02758 [Capronia coronata CBS 617.96]EXJ94364.1 hypothetical protein A1O1_02758 [Capronia coronata CBS 617.96]
MATISPQKTAVGTSEAAGLSPSPAPPERLSLFTRARLFLKIWAMKIQVKVLVGLMRTFNASKLRKTLPTYTKRYEVRPMLENRVFIPSSAQPGAKHPLFMVIHGGGFVLMDPTMDDPINRKFADEHGFVVVSINYRKAPSYPFPTAVHDAAEIARAVLADADLPVDHSKVALGGFSAGGNLTLAIAQLPGIKEKVKSLVPVYPVVDFTGRYEGEFRPGPDGKPDMLQDTAPLFNWAYLPEGQDRTDPLLSPICAGRDRLPQRIFFIGAEYDYLCFQAEIMARKLAGLDETADTGPDWEKNGIKWRMVPNVTHGWTHMPKQGEEEVQRKEGLEVLYKEIADWLKQ